MKRLEKLKDGILTKKEQSFIVGGGMQGTTTSMSITTYKPDGGSSMDTATMEDSPQAPIDCLQ